MKFITKSYRHADIVLSHPDYWENYKDIVEVINNISDDDLKKHHLSKSNRGIKSSLASTINFLIKDRMVEKGWLSEASIFQGEEYGLDKVWRLDFAKESISVEVAFNHGEAIAWNLLKPTLASEVNNVQKAIKTEVGVIITASRNLKLLGAFDSAVGEYEKVLRYLTPLSTLISVPLLIIGLEAPETFKLKSKYPMCEDWGTIIELNE